MRENEAQVLTLPGQAEEQRGGGIEGQRASQGIEPPRSIDAEPGCRIAIERLDAHSPEENHDQEDQNRDRQEERPCHLQNGMRERNQHGPLG